MLLSSVEHVVTETKRPRHGSESEKLLERRKKEGQNEHGSWILNEKMTKELTKYVTAK